MGRFAMYPLALLVWLVYLFLMPRWVGMMYYSDPFHPSTIRVSGTFGLKDDASPRPLWNPPLPYSDGIEATVRYPWQPVNQRYHIEIETSKLVRDFTLGTMTLGIIVGIWQFLTRKHQKNECVGIPPATWASFIAYVASLLLLGGLVLPDVAQLFIPFNTVVVLIVLFCLLMVTGLPRVAVNMARGMSIALAITWTVILVLVMLSSGYILDVELMVIALPLAAMAGGGVVGYYLQHRRS